MKALITVAAAKDFKPTAEYPNANRLQGPSQRDLHNKVRAYANAKIRAFEFTAKASGARTLFRQGIFWARFSDQATTVDGYAPAFGTKDGTVIEFNLITVKGEPLVTSNNGRMDHFAVGLPASFVKRLQGYSDRYQFEPEKLLWFIRNVGEPK